MAVAKRVKVDRRPDQPGVGLPDDLLAALILPEHAVGTTVGAGSVATIQANVERHLEYLASRERSGTSVGFGHHGAGGSFGSGGVCREGEGPEQWWAGSTARAVRLLTAEPGHRTPFSHATLARWAVAMLELRGDERVRARRAFGTIVGVLQSRLHFDTVSVVRALHTAVGTGLAPLARLVLELDACGPLDPLASDPSPRPLALDEVCTALASTTSSVDLEHFGRELARLLEADPDGHAETFGNAIAGLAARQHASPIVKGAVLELHRRGDLASVTRVIEGAARAAVAADHAHSIGAPTLEWLLRRGDNTEGETGFAACMAATVGLVGADGTATLLAAAIADPRAGRLDYALRALTTSTSTTSTAVTTDPTAASAGTARFIELAEAHVRAALDQGDQSVVTRALRLVVTALAASTAGEDPVLSWLESNVAEPYESVATGKKAAASSGTGAAGGASGGVAALKTKGQLQLYIRALEALVPDRPVAVLKAFARVAQRVIAVAPSGSLNGERTKEFLGLVRARLDDFGHGADATQTEQCLADVRKFVEAHAASGKLPDALLELGIFRKKYYVEAVLPALLFPQADPLPPALEPHRRSLCSQLFEKSKVPPHLVAKYREAAAVESRAQGGGGFVDVMDTVAAGWLKDFASAANGLATKVHAFGEPSAEVAAASRAVREVCGRLDPDQIARYTAPPAHEVPGAQGTSEFSRQLGGAVAKCYKLGDETDNGAQHPDTHGGKGRAENGRDGGGGGGGLGGQPHLEAHVRCVTAAVAPHPWIVLAAAARLRDSMLGAAGDPSELTPTAAGAVLWHLGAAAEDSAALPEFCHLFAPGRFVPASRGAFERAASTFQAATGCGARALDAAAATKASARFLQRFSDFFALRAACQMPMGVTTVASASGTGSGRGTRLALEGLRHLCTLELVTPPPIDVLGPAERVGFVRTVIELAGAGDGGPGEAGRPPLNNVLLAIAETVVAVESAGGCHATAVLQALGEASLDVNADVSFLVTLLERRLPLLCASLKSPDDAAIPLAARTTALARVALQLVLRLDARLLLPSAAPPRHGGGPDLLGRREALGDQVGDMVLAVVEAATAADLLGPDGLLPPPLVAHLVRAIRSGAQGRADGGGGVTFDELVDACPPLLLASIWGGESAAATLLVRAGPRSATLERALFVADLVRAHDGGAAGAGGGGGGRVGQSATGNGGASSTAGEQRRDPPPPRVPPGFSCAHAAGRALYAHCTRVPDWSRGLAPLWQRCAAGLGSSDRPLYESLLAVLFDCVLHHLGAELAFPVADHRGSVVEGALGALVRMLETCPGVIQIFDPDPADSGVVGALAHRGYLPSGMAMDDCRRALLFFTVVNRCGPLLTDLLLESTAMLPVTLRQLALLLSASSPQSGEAGVVLSARTVHTCTSIAAAVRDKCGPGTVQVPPAQFATLIKVAPFLRDSLTQETEETASVSVSGKRKGVGWGEAEAVGARRWFTPEVASAFLELAGNPSGD